MFSFAPAIPSRGDIDWCWFLRRQGSEGDAIERILHDIGIMNPGGWADWVPSTLTATGAPVEMQFSEATPGLSLLTEVGDPASDLSSRVGRVCQIMTELGGTAPNAPLRDVISAAQGAGALRFGAWLGLRQVGQHLHTRLLAELPADAIDLASLLWSPEIGQAIHACSPRTRATMLAHDGTTGLSTIYFRAERPDLAQLAATAKVSDTVLTTALARLADIPGGTPLPLRQLGFSFAMHADGKRPVLTLHVDAAELCATDDQIAERLTASCALPMAGYASLLDALPAAPRGQRHHRTISLTARPCAAPTFSVGVAAPWSCPYAVQ